MQGLISAVNFLIGFLATPKVPYITLSHVWKCVMRKSMSLLKPLHMYAGPEEELWDQTLKLTKLYVPILQWNYLC